MLQLCGGGLIFLYFLSCFLTMYKIFNVYLVPVKFQELFLQYCSMFNIIIDMRPDGYRYFVSKRMDASCLIELGQYWLETDCSACMILLHFRV